MRETSIVHPAAAEGFAANASGYARGRPDYPDAIVGWLRDALGLRAGRRVVDVGAGTGLFTARLVETGADVVAVEPVDAMRERLAGRFPAVDAQAGTADALPLPDGSVDAIVCAQAFHWFANDAAMREFARVLRPGGSLGLVWNVRDESVPWVRKLTGIAAPHEGDVPRFHRGDWRRAFPAAGFGPLEESRFPHVHAGPPEAVVVDRFLSVSFIAALPPDAREAVARQLRELVATEPALAGRDVVAFPYETRAFRTVLTDG